MCFDRVRREAKKVTKNYLVDFQIPSVKDYFQQGKGIFEKALHRIEAKLLVDLALLEKPVIELQN